MGSCMLTCVEIALSDRSPIKTCKRGTTVLVSTLVRQLQTEKSVTKCDDIVVFSNRSTSNTIKEVKINGISF